MTTRLLFLGPPRIEVDGETVDLPAKALALLGYLSSAPEPPSRDRILGLLWPESAEEAARKNLRNVLWTIRKALGDIVSGSGDRLSLDTTLVVDVRALLEEAARVAGASPPRDAAGTAAVLELYRAPFLDGLHLVDAPDFEIWLLAEQERVAREALQLAQAVVAWHAAVGQWSEVASAARAGLVADPLHEPLHRALIEAHARLGQRSDSLRQYEALRNALARDLGVEPLPETEVLRAAVARGEFDPQTPPAAPVPVPRPRPAPTEVVPFVGRKEERTALDMELASARAGAARVVLLTGELGIGKSRLWRQWSASS